MNLCFSLFMLVTYFNPGHAFYVSVTDLEYEAQQNVLDVQVKIFTNDLEDEIRNYSNKIINLQDGIDDREGKRVHQYVIEKIQLFVDGQLISLENKSCKLEGDAVFVRYKGILEANPDKLKVKNALLLDLFPTQTNIIRLKSRSKQGMLKLNKRAKMGELQF